MKISRTRPCCSRVERSFIIDNGQLLVYRDHHPNAKVKAWPVATCYHGMSIFVVLMPCFPQAMYQLKDATCFYEDRNSASLPKWMEGRECQELKLVCHSTHPVPLLLGVRLIQTPEHQNKMNKAS